MDIDNLDKRHVLLWEAVSDITEQINSLAQQYAREAIKLADTDLANAISVNAQSLGLLKALEIIDNNLRIRDLLS